MVLLQLLQLYYHLFGENAQTELYTQTESYTQCQFNPAEENINGLFSNLTLLSMLLMSLSKDSKCVKPGREHDEEYDYIIVGGGSAGSVMASRLSENHSVSVLLLEAGGNPPLLTEVPAYNPQFHYSGIDWNYKTTSQKHSCFSQKDNKIRLSSAKVLGGSSGTGAMQYIRGNAKTYDRWAEEGATGWNYTQVLCYFKKLENNTNNAGLDVVHHHKGGPVTVEMPKYAPEIKEPLIKALKAMGYKVLDVNGKQQTGIFDIQDTVRRQQRCGTKKAYLDHAMNRSNLHILINAFVTKILIHNDTKEAYGVEFEYNKNTTHSVFAKKEVIIANGAIRTPQLLMLSGIGPKEQLKKFNIDPVAYLPVGKNLQDHPSSSLYFTVNETITPVAEKIRAPANVKNYTDYRKGPLTAPDYVTILSYLKGSKSSKDVPKVEMWYMEGDVEHLKVLRNFKDEIFEKVYGPYVGKPMYQCSLFLLEPCSRGEVTLNSKDPRDMPNINPNYYKCERDVEIIAEGMEMCNATANQPAMKRVQAQHINTSLPACQHLRGKDKEFYRCSARQVVASYWHYSGTARMGSPKDKTSVVDPELRVIGVEKLRVVSAAVFPIIPSGDTNIPTIMVAEKAADMIKKDANVNCSNADIDKFFQRI